MTQTRSTRPLSSSKIRTSVGRRHDGPRDQVSCAEGAACYPLAWSGSWLSARSTSGSSRESSTAAVRESGHDGLVRGKRQECLQTLLPDEHHDIPSVRRSDRSGIPHTKRDQRRQPAAAIVRGLEVLPVAFDRDGDDDIT